MGRRGDKKMKKKIICILVCTLFLTMTFSVTSAQKMTKEYEKDETHSNIVLDNHPPTDPAITCPDTVKKNRIFMARALSFDPDGDDIYYRLTVGESEPSQWIGPRESGVEYATGVGIFEYIGEIIIGFQAKDKWGLSSGWSYHTVNITKGKPIISPLLGFLEQHPRLLPILRQLLDL